MSQPSAACIHVFSTEMSGGAETTRPRERGINVNICLNFLIIRRINFHARSSAQGQEGARRRAAKTNTLSKHYSSCIIITVETFALLLLGAFPSLLFRLLLLLASLGVRDSVALCGWQNLKTRKFCLRRLCELFHFPPDPSTHWRTEQLKSYYGGGKQL